ncbi:MAG TPA: peptidoglycan-binding domain-containing protein [Chthoniobacteraceae bacterium]|nr:peptidoglycan-binding domain-containing protein [Chthoniobacteraceae bacterium]
MKRIVLLLLLVLGASVRADELTKRVQTELKELGFYYSEITGVNNAETVAALRRYQIRNGLEVTGTLNKNTLEALGMGDSKGPAPAPAPAKKEPPVNLRRDETETEADRNFLRREATREPTDHDSSAVAPPAPLNPPADPGTEGYVAIFARTPFETAPAEVQVSTLRKAQQILARSGYYRDPIDGVPGPATEEAILGYQRRRNLTLTGRLDLDTLSAMALLPGRGDGPAVRPFTVPPGSRYSPRTFRGMWIY